MRKVFFPLCFVFRFFCFLFFVMVVVVVGGGVEFFFRLSRFERTFNCLVFLFQSFSINTAIVIPRVSDEALIFSPMLRAF